MGQDLQLEVQKLRVSEVGFRLPDLGLGFGMSQGPLAVKL